MPPGSNPLRVTCESGAFGVIELGESFKVTGGFVLYLWTFIMYLFGECLKNQNDGPHSTRSPLWVPLPPIRTRFLTSLFCRHFCPSSAVLDVQMGTGVECIF